MSQQKTNYPALGFLVLIAGAAVLFSDPFTPVSADVTPFVIAEKTQLGDETVSVPDWGIFKTGGTWDFVGGDSRLPETYEPSLVVAPVGHVSGEFKVSKTIEKPLKALVEKAKNDGVNLMLSSAYRSQTDQKQIYDFYERTRGKAYVQTYVAPPGASEHQTGLAVDIATASSACQINGDACSLDAQSIAWLRTNAAAFGFIERYPSGKQSITGVAGEHWHYRYVGVPLAKALKASNLTFDEFVQQAAPGYAR